jgi:hypothetical protein
MRGFAQLVYENNPGCQIYVMASYVGETDNWATAMNQVQTIFKPLADSISLNYPGHKKVLMVPMLSLMNRIRLVIQSGASPDLGAFSSFYAGPGDIHFAPNGLYVEALAHFATIYKQDPHGAIRTGLYMWSGDYSVDSDFAQAAQDVVWEYLTSDSTTGLQPTKLAARPTPPRDLSGAWTVSADLSGRSLVVGRSTASAVVAGGVYVAGQSSTKRSWVHVAGEE